MLIFLILVNYFEHLIVDDFHQKAIKQRPKLKYMFSDFCVLKIGIYSRLFLRYA